MGLGPEPMAFGGLQRLSSPTTLMIYENHDLDQPGLGLGQPAADLSAGRGPGAQVVDFPRLTAGMGCAGLISSPWSPPGILAVLASRFQTVTIISW